MVTVGLYLLSHLSDRLDTGSVQVVVVLSCLNEAMVLNVLFHLLSGDYKMIISAIHLIVSLGPGRVCKCRTVLILRVMCNLIQYKSVWCSVQTYEERKNQTCQGTQR